MRPCRTVPFAAAGALVLTALAAPAPGAVPDDGPELTLLATTDVHGRALNWDYFAEAPYDAPEDVLGLALLSSVVADVRAEKGEESVVVLDNGDAIQGTPLTELYGLAEPITETGAEHPMATAFNLMGYDAQVVGNHEYDYGLDVLAAYEEDLTAPLLGANVLDAATGEPYHEPYTLIERTIDGEQVTVGVVGLLTPALSSFVVEEIEGQVVLADPVAAAREWVPVARAAGADVVVVLAHTGEGTVPDAGYDPSAAYEDVAANVARMVPGIDVVVAGHSHQDVPARVYENADGGRVLLTQPYYWARSMSEVTLELVPDGDGWAVDWSAGNAPSVEPHYGHEVAAADPALIAALEPAHRAAIEYVAQAYEPVAEATELMRARTARYEDTPILDFVTHVQAEVVRDALAGTASADLPILAQASPLSRTAVFPQGMVTTGHIAGLYLYPNTLTAVELTGAQVRDYLENAARYYAQVEEGAPFDPATGTNAEGIGDYNYDVLSGVHYAIDVSQPAGQRVTAFTHPDGTPVADDDRFVLALNNFRQTGAGGYPHVADAPVLYTGQDDIRDLLADWARARGVIDPDDFFVENWRVVTAPVPAPSPTDEPAVPTDPTVAPTPAPSAPGTPPATAAPSPTTTPAGGGELPATGAPGASVALMAGAALLAGAALALARRRAAS
ncbi:bifunctional metallophosphatase/5'-nucleotidase [Georgenia faecalis]|uniref:5'-nucleotidase C-terminal domain-containing protein n=1 Tax=Georgenia faecalis TaxID=2483799 RepID=A0ABV9D9N4_9MICO|nr:5'-nucleotidase C-terminal domain-containing protein [Georgenia faecalis]